MNRILATITLTLASLGAAAAPAVTTDFTGTVSKVLSARELVITDEVGEVHVYKDARIGGSYGVGDTIRVSATPPADWLKLYAREVIAKRITLVSSAPVQVSQATP
jgi:hypothetical protein